MNRLTLQLVIGMISIFGITQTASSAVTWTKCATESGTCSFSGTREVRYGTATKFVTKAFKGTTPCTNAVFGDPAYGILKTCSYSSVTSVIIKAPTTPVVVTPPVVVVPAPVISSFNSSSASIIVGSSATLSWSETGSTSLTLSNVGTVTGKTSQVVTPAATTTYTLTAVNATGTKTSTVTVTVNPAPVVPVTVQKTFSTMSVSAAILPNPDKGWDGWSGSDFVTSYDAGSVTGGFNSGNRHLHCQISLKSYITTPTLPADFLNKLTASFAKIRSQGMKCVLLFSYNQDSSGTDATAPVISSHLKSLKPVLYANADVISFVKAGFIGAWGEWHSSKNGNSCGYNAGNTTCATANANRIIVRDALLDAFPPSVTIQFRYPADLMLWYPNGLTAANAFNGSAQARVGHHNDCQQSGSNDTGTYTGSVATQQAYITSLTQYTPYGGEHSQSCAAPFRTSCAEILAEGAKYHLAWLKGPSDDIAAWLTAWKAGGCYNEVVNKIGYRLQLDSISHPDIAAKNSNVAFNINMRNVGWAKVFSARKLQVVLVNGSKTYIAEATTNLTALPEQATGSSTVKINFAVPADAPAGNYTVYLRAPDAWTSTAARAEYTIRFANSDNSSMAQAWDPTNSRFATGTALKVQ